jgi:hypothetical protein
MAVESEPIFRLARQYRDKFKLNPKAVVVLSHDGGNEVVGRAGVNKLFKGSRYFAAMEAGLLERVYAPAAPSVTMTAAAETKAPVILAPVSEPDEFEHNVYDEDLDIPSAEMAGALSAIASSTIEGAEASDKESQAAITEPESGPDHEPAHNESASEEDSEGSKEAVESRPVRRRRVKRG